ncbi:hypothetical protein ACTG9Q_01200 [Actinokineospora sp. 24-640]
MTDWLDQLRRLDQALAAGEISAAQHRSKRDEILAEASSAQPLMARPQPATGPGLPAEPPRHNQHQVPASWPLPAAETASARVTPGQAQAIFSTAQSTTSKPWPAALAALLVLVLIAAGIWLWSFSGADPVAGPTTTTQAPSRFTELRLPGQADIRSGDMRLQQARQENLITAEEAALLIGLGVNKVTYVGSADKPYQFLAFSYPSADPGGQTEKIRSMQRDLGYTAVDVADLPEGFEAVQWSNTRASQLRLTYTSASATVQLIVLQVPLGEQDELLGRARDAVAAATAVAPPD